MERKNTITNNTAAVGLVIASPHVAAVAAESMQADSVIGSPYQHHRRNRRLSDQQASLKERQKKEKRDCKIQFLDKPKTLKSSFLHCDFDEGMGPAPSTAFVKPWRVKDEGRDPLPASCVLRLAGRNKLKSITPEAEGSHSVSEETSQAVPVGEGAAVEPNKKVGVSFSLAAPTKSGNHARRWRTCTPDGRKFGRCARASFSVPPPDEVRKREVSLALVDSVLKKFAGLKITKRRVVSLLLKFNCDVTKVEAMLEKRARKAEAAKKHNNKEEMAD